MAQPPVAGQTLVGGNTQQRTFNRDAAYVAMATGKQQLHGFAGLDQKMDSDIYSRFVSWAIRQLTILRLQRISTPTVSSRRVLDLTGNLERKLVATHHH